MLSATIHLLSSFQNLIFVLSPPFLFVCLGLFRPPLPPYTFINIINVVSGVTTVYILFQLEMSLLYAYYTYPI